MISFPPMHQAAFWQKTNDMHRGVGNHKGGVEPWGSKLLDLRRQEKEPLLKHRAREDSLIRTCDLQWAEALLLHHQKEAGAQHPIFSVLG